jgi:hypothetical protein
MLFCNIFCRWYASDVWSSLSETVSQT